jgi:NAD(P)-dependent dehydrogenase (short-subunit alcohol dehydrogenase family)
VDLDHSSGHTVTTGGPHQPPTSLAGRVAVITGGSRGIGLATARAFVDAGARVMITSRKADQLEEAVAALGPGTAWFAGNAGDEKTARACAEATLARFGRLDVLVNGAGVNIHFGSTIDVEHAAAEKILHANVLGPMMWMKWAWRLSMAERGGSIVNMASLGGVHIEPNLGMYNASKAALIQLTRQLAAELAPSVRVNAVAPGLVRTEFARAIWAADEAAATARTPLGRIGEVSDVSAAVLYLASDAAAWVTGQVLTVDGGASVRGAVPRKAAAARP